MKISGLVREGEITISVVEPNIQTQTAISSLKLGIWRLDVSNGSLTVCKRCRQILPILDERTASVDSLADIMATGYQEKFAEIVLLSRQTGCHIDFEFPLKDQEGSCQKWLRVTAATGPCTDTLQMRVFGTIEDISERKFTEQAGKDFLSIASHDLRSPLTVIKLYLQMCREWSQNIHSDFVAGILEKADRQVNRMSKIIQSFLQVSAIEAGELILCKESFDMKSLVNEVIEDFILLNPVVRFILKCRPTNLIFADRGKIFQVVQNLLGNAIKYSPGSGRIIIKIRQKGNNVLLTIKDFGSGIKTVDKNRIFDRFYRIQDEKNKHIQGYGVGLFISRKIILLHHGEIWMKSREGKGSIFCILLPLN